MVFEQDAIFHGVTFGGSAEFQAAVFRGLAGFNGAVFTGAAFFIRDGDRRPVRFEEPVNFTGGQFRSQVEFQAPDSQPRRAFTA